MAKCKRCGVKTVLSDEDIQSMVEEVTSMSGVRLVDETTYKERFNICSDCERLMYGQTCAACGCIIQVRARLSGGRCPKKKW